MHALSPHYRHSATRLRCLRAAASVILVLRPTSSRFSGFGPPGAVAGVPARTAAIWQFSLFFHFRICGKSSAHQPRTPGRSRLDRMPLRLTAPPTTSAGGLRLGVSPQDPLTGGGRLQILLESRTASRRSRASNSSRRENHRGSTTSSCSTPCASGTSCVDWNEWPRGTRPPGTGADRKDSRKELAEDLATREGHPVPVLRAVARPAPVLRSSVRSAWSAIYQSL